ncbi:MAG: response regulator [Anaerolineales bacterium]|nr:response regulator [Anaerolineales bacterium]
MSESAENNIRVLIVDDIAETRENIRKLLQFESDIEVVGAARTGEEAIALASESEPDVVLMDINMPDMDGISATEALLKDVPYAQIVILSVQSEADYMRRAMLAGARDFIAKPPSGDELIATIRSLSSRAREQKKSLERPLPQVAKPQPGLGYALPEGKLISLYSAKGGVGCTVLATNLAVGLHTDETPAVLVDASLQFGDIAVSLNLQAKFSIADVSSRTEEIDPEFIEDVLLNHESGLKILAAPPRPEMADEVHADQVRKVLAHLRRQFAYVIVDTSSNMDDIALAVLDLADVLVMVAAPEIPSIKDARLLFDLLSVLEFPKERVFFILNKMDRKSGITPDAIEENLSCTVHGVIPFDEKSVSASVNRGVPVLLSDRSSVAAKSIFEILGALKAQLVSYEKVVEE